MTPGELAAVRLPVRACAKCIRCYRMLFLFDESSDRPRVNQIAHCDGAAVTVSGICSHSENIENGVGCVDG